MGRLRDPRAPLGRLARLAVLAATTVLPPAAATAQRPLGGPLGALVGGFGDPTAGDAAARLFGGALPRGRDGSAAVDAELGFAITLPAGNPGITTASVCTNGFVYFLPLFTADGCLTDPRPGLTASRALDWGGIVAPFLADARTDGPGSGAIHVGTGTWDGRAAWAATWAGVTPDLRFAPPGTDPLARNWFQAVLVDAGAARGAGAFDLVLNYGAIGWGTGFGGPPTAAIGWAFPDYATGDLAAAYEPPFSRGDALLGGPPAPDALPAGGPCRTLWGCRIQAAFDADGALVAPPVVGLAGAAVVPEPATLALLAGGMGLLAAGARVRRRSVERSAHRPPR